MPEWKLPPNYGEEEQVRNMHRDLAHVHSFLDSILAGRGWGQPSLNQADGIHPTAEGYRIVVEQPKVLLPVLNKLAAKGRDKRRRETSSPLTMSRSNISRRTIGRSRLALLEKVSYTPKPKIRAIRHVATGP